MVQGLLGEAPGVQAHGFAQGRGGPMHPPPPGQAGQFGAPGSGALLGHAKGRGMQSERVKGRGRGDRIPQSHGPRGSLDGVQGEQDASSPPAAFFKE